MAWRWRPTKAGQPGRAGLDWVKPSMIRDQVRQAIGLRVTGDFQTRLDVDGRTVFHAAVADPRREDNEPNQDTLAWYQLLEANGSRGSEQSIYNRLMTLGIETSVAIGRPGAHPGSIAITLLRAIEPAAPPEDGFCGLVGRP
jgi:hypothetical protein